MKHFQKIVNGISISMSSSGDQCLSISGSGIEVNSEKITASASPLTSKEFSVAQFSELEAGGSFEISVKRGDAAKVVVTAEEHVMPHVVANVQGGTLRLGTQGSVMHTKPIQVEISVPALSSIELSGSSSMVYEDTAGSLLNVQASGAVNIKLNGIVGALKVHASGASNIRAQKLRAASVTLQASGAANIHAMAESSVSGQLSGAASVEIEGNPVSRSIRTSGAASVNYK